MELRGREGSKRWRRRDGKVFDNGLHEAKLRIDKSDPASDGLMNR